MVDLLVVLIGTIVTATGGAVLLLFVPSKL